MLFFLIMVVKHFSASHNVSDNKLATENQQVPIIYGTVIGGYMRNYNEAINQIYAEKEQQIIIGLTGRTGAGCSTVAGILKKRFENLELECSEDSDIKEKKTFEIIKKYIATDDRWVPFVVVEGSCVILSYIFEFYDKEKDGFACFIDYLKYLQSDKNVNCFRIVNFSEFVQEIHGLRYIFDEVKKMPLNSVTKWDVFSDEEIKAYYELYVEKMVEYKNRIKRILFKYSCYEEKKSKLQDFPPIKYHLYTYLLQKIANNIRASGNPYDSSLHQEKILDFAKRIEIIIELIKKYKSDRKIRICIDAIRNANESNYLKDVYRSYYLISISVEEKTRRNRLGALDQDEQKSLDSVEYESKLDGGEIFYHQNIANCFEMADIHLVNLDEKNNRRLVLTRQLVKYITLMIHPGLVLPSDIERCMQLAYNAKYNSGCLSRQVGAVVTGDDYAVKSVGWNDVPNNQLECIYRDVNGYCRGNQEECFSEFEYEDSTFKHTMQYMGEQLEQEQVNLHGRKFSYCFKDIYNGLKNDKNQVYTRALHAEENAFLQISKYGGQPIKGGYLFCTASPCELCSKKAFQLGIRKIYYIDPYPGIAQKHILSFGKKTYNPDVELFCGAIGEAYVRLYRPMIAPKDELELVSGINSKEEAHKSINPTSEQPLTKDLLYHNIEVSLEFNNREEIKSVRTVDIEVVNGEYSGIDRTLTWTGSSYDKSELIDNDNRYSLVDSKDQMSPYHYRINFNKIISEEEHIFYRVKSYVKDESHLMHPYFAHMVRYPTKKLVLTVIIPEKFPPLENVRYVRYADLQMECEFLDDLNNFKEEKEDNKIIYRLEINNPNLFYTYSLEWDFMNIKS